MPLYELIAICKPGKAAQVARTAAGLRQAVEKYGGVLRTCAVLGDRVLSRTLRSSDLRLFAVGRYVQFMLDANPDVLPGVKAEARLLDQVLELQVFRARDFYQEAQRLLRVDENLSIDERQILFEAERAPDLDHLLAHFRARRAGGKA